MWECKYCKVLFDFNNSQKANHSRWCLKNPKRSEYENEVKKLGSFRKTFANQFIKAKKFGLAKPIQPEPWNKGKIGLYHHSEEIKKRLSDIKKEAIKNGTFFTKAGRCKKYKHISPIAGEILVDGTWELKFCKWADEKGIIYERNKVGFKYLKENGKQSLYFPDFKLQDGRYIEVKGYETDLDRCKWRQFPYTLIILRKFEIENLNKLLLQHNG